MLIKKKRNYIATDPWVACSVSFTLPRSLFFRTRTFILIPERSKRPIEIDALYTEGAIEHKGATFKATCFRRHTCFERVGVRNYSC